MDTFLIVIFLILLILFFLFKSKKSSFTGVSIYDRFKDKFEYHPGPIKLADQVYCIVMPDRKNDMINFMNKYGISCNFLNAVTPADLTPEDYKNLASTELFRSKKKTRLPLQLSFSLCYLDAIKRNYQTIIIFEDDIVLNTDLNTIEKSISEFKNSNYSMFYMGYCYLNCKQSFKPNKDSLLVNVNDYSKMYCAHSIVYKVKYLKSMIDYLYPMREEFDVAILKYSKRAGNKLCIPKQVYFSQNKSLGTNNETLNSDGTIDKDPPTCKIK
jgi:hypothetical protein